MAGIGEALVTFRQARGMTQAELAERSGVTQAALSRYESDLRSPDDEVIDALAGALGVTREFLRRSRHIRGPMAVDVHMRRRATAKATVWRQLEARLNTYRMHARQLFEEITMRAEQTVPRFDPLETPAADAARMVRMQWRMPIGPVRGTIRWLESAGCLVIMEDFGTARVDGLSQWVDDLPVMLVNRRSPVDRIRLTLAHELGHLCLHSVDFTNQMEQDADQFAAEFLMPTEAIRTQLRNLDLGRLLDLKREWGVSMQALIEKAHSLKLITPGTRTNLYKALSARGWRTREPVSEELMPETVSLPSDIAAAVLDRGLNADELARIAGFASDTDNTVFRPAQPHLHAV
ncbi:helix-turn-helix domain-containing protein [Sciscionella marina]|uniref:helix-turn-helix domain-containing protein n=1 Tax=Sciscionella marina TaxID=508770 RepID=UPI000475F57A|nr:XRE family transcriptional regulator [Sciscionella marina]